MTTGLLNLVLKGVILHTISHKIGAILVHTQTHTLHVVTNMQERGRGKREGGESGTERERGQNQPLLPFYLQEGNRWGTDGCGSQLCKVLLAGRNVGRQVLASWNLYSGTPSCEACLTGTVRWFSLTSNCFSAKCFENLMNQQAAWVLPSLLPINASISKVVGWSPTMPATVDPQLLATLNQHLFFFSGRL